MEAQSITLEKLHPYQDPKHKYNIVKKKRKEIQTEKPKQSKLHSHLLHPPIPRISVITRHTPSRRQNTPPTILSRSPLASQSGVATNRIKPATADIHISTMAMII